MRLCTWKEKGEGGCRRRERGSEGGWGGGGGGAGGRGERHEAVLKGIEATWREKGERLRGVCVCVGGRGERHETM